MAQILSTQRVGFHRANVVELVARALRLSACDSARLKLDPETGRILDTL